MTSEFLASLDWQPLSTGPLVAALTPDEAGWFLHNWLNVNSLSLAITDESVEEVNINGTIYYMFKVYYDPENYNTYFSVYANAVTGELFAPGDGQNFNLITLDTWYDIYGDYLY